MAIHMNPEFESLINFSVKCLFSNFIPTTYECYIIKMLILPFGDTSHCLLIMSMTITHYFPNHLWRQVLDSSSNSNTLKHLEMAIRSIFGSDSDSYKNPLKEIRISDSWNFIKLRIRIADFSNIFQGI